MYTAVRIQSEDPASYELMKWLAVRRIISEFALRKDT
jgi:hypothetical protein